MLVPGYTVCQYQRRSGRTGLAMRAAGRAKLIALLVMVTVTTGMTIEAGTASASGVDRARPAAFPTSAGALSGIAMTSGSNGWAVGYTGGGGGGVILRWDGSRWH